MPFCSLIEKLAVKTFKNKGNEEIDVFGTLDERFLSVPSFAVEKCKELVCDMAEISGEAFKKAVKLLNSFDKTEFEKIQQLEESVDKYEDKTSTYLVKIAANQMSAKDSKAVTELLHCIGDIERISDHALNIAKAAKEVSDKDLSFSEKATKDIKVMTDAVSEILDIAINVLETDDLSVAKSVEPLERVIDRLKRKIKAGHISRLRQGDCTMELGFILSDLINNCERVADHCSNIAVCVIELANDSFETHEYVHQLETGGHNEYRDMYEQYKEKYYI